MVATMMLLTLLRIGDLGESLSLMVIQSKDEEKLAIINESISKTTQEGIQIIEKALRSKPIVYGQRSTWTLKDIVDYQVTEIGIYNLNPIGWECSKKESGRWRVVFYYQNYKKEYLSAEWEYDEKTRRLYASGNKNAADFWSSATKKKVNPLKHD